MGRKERVPMDELIRKLREKINARINLRNDYAKELDELSRAADVDDAKVDEVRAKKASLDSEIEEQRARLEELEKERKADEAVARLQDESKPSGTGEDQRERGNAGSGIVVSEKRQDNAQSDPDGQSFLKIGRA